MTAAERDLAIARARERADLARIRFGNALETMAQRLSPERLKEDAIEAATEGLEHAKRDLMKRLRYWPVLVGPLLVALALLIFWRPARALAGHILRAASLVWTYRNLWSSWK